MLFGLEPMDIFYNPYELIQFQIALMIVGLVSCCVLGFLVSNRRIRLGLTLLSWACLALFYAAQAPSGTPFLQ
ncbi:hypothetical protein predicted by Glimmer/Critica (plasmid) [Acetobacter ghanensis]|uniref:Uncharacterized protein n=1 Tax=Acetobacter ghanensis TaxID=431306 RepID=A0A0U5F8P8_9PROT|nr:hypothetical protein predicted by Glimmer/Critica [Acetobacter ghanensis]